uniref:Uncharacterized protein n=1 Tax=Romanomermis culicivorax TaxID=13658 RepID=A0A915IXC7_ROMCU
MGSVASRDQNDQKIVAGKCHTNDKTIEPTDWNNEVITSVQTRLQIIVQFTCIRIYANNFLGHKKEKNFSVHPHYLRTIFNSDIPHEETEDRLACPVAVLWNDGAKSKLQQIPNSLQNNSIGKQVLFHICVHFLRQYTSPLKRLENEDNALYALVSLHGSCRHLAIEFLDITQKILRFQNIDYPSEDYFPLEYYSKKSVDLVKREKLG